MSYKYISSKNITDELTLEEHVCAMCSRRFSHCLVQEHYLNQSCPFFAPDLEQVKLAFATARNVLHVISSYPVKISEIEEE